MKKLIIVCLSALLLSIAPLNNALARGFHGSSRVSYGGGHHTSSHGGHYAGASSGRSHKGGTYKNIKTNNQYGTHK